MMARKTKYGRLAQLVEHSLDVRVVSGSNPLASTTKTECKCIRFFFLLQHAAPYYRID